MNNQSSVVGLIFVVMLVAGLTCRWEEWDHKDTAGVSVFRYRNVLLPWQDAPAPHADVKVSTVTMHRQSYYGLNRFDYSGPPAALASPTDQPGHAVTGSR